MNDLVAARAAAVDRGAEIVETPPEILQGLHRPPERLGDAPTVIPAPTVPLSSSDLLANAEGQPNIGSELRLELASADSVDLLCAFVIWSGVVRLRDALAGVIERGGRIRVITTTYMGATQRTAVDELARIGAQVRVAFDARMTKLHAKAWLLERESGLSTAFIGSSNLSHTALFDGLEWNVRLSSVDAKHVIERVRSMFESYWASEHFEPYDPATGGERLDRALGAHRDRDAGASVSFIGLDVHPYPHQQRMLERLMVERERHGRHRNLVVAATGTGKTVVAALDYRQLRQRAGTRPLVALRRPPRANPRAESCHVPGGPPRRLVRRDPRRRSRFGGRHVFAMIQSVSEEDVARLRSAGLRRRHRRRVPPRGGAELSAAARPPRSRRAPRADRDAGADGRAGRDRVLRRSHRGRAAAVGGDRRGLSRPVPVLRRRRRHGSLRSATGSAAAIGSRGAEPRGDRRRARVAKLLEAIRRVIVRARPNARAWLLRFG